MNDTLDEPVTVKQLYKLANVLHNIALLRTSEGPMDRVIRDRGIPGEGLGPLYLRMAEVILTEPGLAARLVQLIAQRPTSTEH